MRIEGLKNPAVLAFDKPPERRSAAREGHYNVVAMPRDGQGVNLDDFTGAVIRRH